MAVQKWHHLTGSWIAGRPAATALILMALAAVFFIPGLGDVSLFDWDEANFAEASREMLERGDYLRVTIDYQPFYQKPPLFFWLQALSMKLFGVNEFAARFVNAACGMATLAIVFLVGRRIYSATFGLLWALAFLGSFLPHFFFKSGIIDPVFNLFIFLGFVSAAKAIPIDRPTRRIGWYALAGTCIGLATLAKGPVAPLVFCLTLCVYWASRRFKIFFTAADIAVFLGATAAVTCVFFAVETLSHGTGFIREFVAYQVKLFSTGDAGHGRPFYFHFFVLLFGCFPASFFAIVSFVKRHEPEPRQRLFNRLMIALFWVVLVLFSIVKTKTVLYSSLAWFPITYCAALHLENLITSRRALRGPLLAALAVFGGLVSLAIALFPVLIINKEWIVPLIRDKFALACLERPVHWSGYEFLLGAGYGCALTLALALFARARHAAGTLCLFGSSAATLLAFMFVFAPKIEAYTQGGPVAFYKTHSGEDAYVSALFKSYADLFYSRKKPTGNPRSHTKEWLLRGPIDKPAYFVARSTQSAPYDDPSLGLIKLSSEYGFSYYRRNPPGNDSTEKR